MRPPFNSHYTASVFASQDPVAIDSVGADFLMNEPTVTRRSLQRTRRPASPGKFFAQTAFEAVNTGS